MNTGRSATPPGSLSGLPALTKAQRSLIEQVLDWDGRWYPEGGEWHTARALVRKGLAHLSVGEGYALTPLARWAVRA